MKTFALFSLLGFGCMAHAVMIDDFSTGNINDVISIGSQFSYTAASVPGGNRWVYHSISANPFNLTHSNVIINGVFASDSKTSVDAGSIIGYGVDSVGGFSVGTDLNLDLSTQNAFQINVLSNDLPATLQIAIRTNGGTLTFSSLHNLTPGMVMTPQVVTISFAEFGAQNFADVDTIGIYLDTTASGDTVIDSFEAVPEPASLIALGLGAAALVARKRK